MTLIANQPGVLTKEEVVACRKAFARFDRNNSGAIDVQELKAALTALNQYPTEAELSKIMKEFDSDNSKEIEFHEFTKVISKQKESMGHQMTDTEEAFIALGGNKDLTGAVSIAKLKRVLDEFELIVDVDGLMESLDKDDSGTVEFNEFKALLD